MVGIEKFEKPVYLFWCGACAQIGRLNAHNENMQQIEERQAELFER